MRQDHRAGEKLFVDYAGQTASVIDRSSGEVRPAQLYRCGDGGVQLHLCGGDQSRNALEDGVPVKMQRRSA